MYTEIMDIYGIPEIKRLIHSFDFPKRYYVGKYNRIKKRKRKNLNLLKQHHFTFKARYKRDGVYNTFPQYYFYDNFDEHEIKKSNKEKQWMPKSKQIAIIFKKEVLQYDYLECLNITNAFELYKMHKYIIYNDINLFTYKGKIYYKPNFSFYFQEVSIKEFHELRHYTCMCNIVN